MAKKDEISSSVIKRLPRYYRFIGELIQQGNVRISSADLAGKMSLTASQIRQDLNCFGGFGQQGYGYNLEELRSEIGKILGVDRCKKAVLFGAGNLGRAIAIHMNFEKFGYKLCGIFDCDENKWDMKIGELRVMPMQQLESFIKDEKPIIAILCIPKDGAQELADTLIGQGIKAFWNFSHYDLIHERISGDNSINYDSIVVENVHLGDSLMLLSYGLTNL